MNSIKQLRAVLVFIAIFHFVFGLGLMLSIDFQKAAISLYGGTLEWTPTPIFFIRVIGSFAFVLGYLAWMASRDPIRHKVIIIGFIEFFILRNINRHLFADEVFSVLNISQTINIMTSIFFGLQALLLGYLLWMASRENTKAMTC